MRGAHALGADAAALGLTRVRRFTEPHTDTQGFVAVHGNDVIVCFRGSESAQDWITNVSTRQVTTEARRKAHAGFVAAHRSAWPLVRAELIAALIELNHGRVWFTGHSLGGALALLAARETASRIPARIAGVVTFGAPRVGNRTWARDFDRLLGERTFRLVNEEDPVPRVPLAARGFQHVGQELFFTPLGKRLTNPPVWVKAFCGIADLLKSWSRLQLAVATDHCIANYVRLAERDARLNSPNLT